jgi:predicted Na+-dependent transporter
MKFHQLQLMVCAALAQGYARNATPETGVTSWWPQRA